MITLKGVHQEKKYLLAVSGGIDSMVLCDLFLKQNVFFAVVHCNFQLRVHDADLDEALVSAWCTQHQIQFFTRKMETTQYAESNKMSIQLAARELRYAYFQKILETESYDFIATAHHQDDSIETTLFHFLRGTGIQGLTGIPEVNKQVIRPILHCSKKEIIAYALNNHIAYREDSSNIKNNYTRNKLRNLIIPQLEEIFPSFKENMTQNISRFKEVDEIYQRQILVYRKKLIEQRGQDYYISILKLKLASPLPTILYELLKPFHFSFEQCLQVIAMMESQTGSLIENKYFRVIKNRNFFIITEINTSHTDLILIEAEATQVNTENFILTLGQRGHVQLEQDATICQIDASVIEYPLLLRKWREGDYMYPLGMSKKKKISRILIDAKMPLHEKEKVWVLESNKRIMWLVGIKIDNRFKLKENTKAVLQIQLLKK